MGKESKEMKAAVGPSMTNIVMLYLSLIGVGVIGGYGAFYLMFSQRCVKLLQASEATYNASHEEWENKYKEALNDKHECLNPLNELQGRLEAQSTLAERHQALLLKQEETLAKLSEAQKSQQEASESHASLKSRIGQLEMELKQSTQKLQDAQDAAQKEQENLQRQLNEAEKFLAQRGEEIKSLTKSNNKCADRLPVLQGQMERMRGYIQTRAKKVCRMEYGKGPFYIEFQLQFPNDEETSSFVVEMTALSNMPHAVFVFLELITLKLYDGTKIFGADHRFIEGGSPTTGVDAGVSTALTERFDKFGYQPSMAFDESSKKATHTEFTIGFVEMGPSWAINMENNTNKRGPQGTFGKVIKGFDTLERLQKAPKQGDDYVLQEPVTIVSVNKVKAPK